MERKPVIWKTLTTIICRDCGQEKDPVFTNGRAFARCQECLAIRHRNLRHEREEAKPEVKIQRALATKEADWKRNYGLTREEYDKLFQFQDGVCAICKQESETPLHVDHNHNTGEIRGLLCQRCNHAIGLLREDPTIISNAYDYLDRTTWNRGLDLVPIRKKA